MAVPTLLIADDHPLFCAALQQAATAAVPGCHIMLADSLATTFAQLEAHADVDLLLLDLHMPGSHGLTGLGSIRARFPTVATLVVSAHDEPRIVQRALNHGASGFIPKNSAPASIGDAIRTVLDCRPWIPADIAAALSTLPANPDDEALAQALARLTGQQFRVLEMISQGLINKQIAAQLGIQERTVKAHVSAILERLGAANRTQASVMLRSLDLQEPARSG